MSFSAALPNNLSTPNISSSRFISRPKRMNIAWPAVAICCGSQVGLAPLLAVRAEQQPTPVAALDPEHVNPDDKKGNTKGSNAGGVPKFSLSNIPSWAQLLMRFFLLALPTYKNFLKVEDRVEKTATSVLDMVENVAEKVEEVAKDIEKLLPENSSLKKYAQTVEKFAEEVDKDAEMIESFVGKVDDVVDKFDAMVQPIIEVKMAHEGSKSTVGVSTGGDAKEN